jgi:hypothetical protein
MADYKVNKKSIYERFREAGKDEGIGFAPHPVDRSKSFDLNNSGGLTKEEYVYYLYYLETYPYLRMGKPLKNPTQKDFSGLVKAVENEGLEFGKDDSDVELDSEPDLYANACSDLSLELDNE